MVAILGATIVLPFLASKAFPKFFHDDPKLALSLALWILIIGMAVSLFVETHKSSLTGSLDQVLALTRKITKKHMKTLCIKKAQMVYIDDYGVLVDKGFEREVNYFIDNVLAPSMETIAWRPYRIAMISAIKDQIDRQSGSEKRTTETDEIPANPIAFERWCMNRLSDAGWQARPTPATGDQGADCVAAKGDIRIVLQCKLHSSPCGNKAVQEVAAARSHYQAQYGIVVATNGFTKSARQLATTNNIYLIHANQLSEVDDIICGGM